MQYICALMRDVFVIRVGLGCILELGKQLGPHEIWAVFGEWVKLGLVCILVGQITFRLCLSDGSD